MRLHKYHGLGNDYLILETAEAVDAGLVRRLCDRHQGVGSDGLLQPLPLRREKTLRRERDSGRPVTPYALRIWNPDGSRAEKSGNGLRIFARWLVDHRGAPQTFDVEVRTTEAPGQVVRCHVQPPSGTGTITVEMGRASFEAHQIPCTRSLVDAPLQVGGRTLRVTAVGTGNPHCVVFLDDLAQLDDPVWLAWGAELERHACFPNRVNVQFAVVLPADAGEPSQDPVGVTRIAARIWERGAGQTQASGSSSCAIAAAARRLGLAGDRVIVDMPGGELCVTLGPDDQLTLVGPVVDVCSIDLSASWLGQSAVVG